MEMMFENNYYYNLKDILNVMNSTFNKGWYNTLVNKINESYGFTFDYDESVFSDALGAMLMNPTCYILKTTEELTSVNDELLAKLLIIVNKYNSIINDYKSYYDGLNTQLTTIKSKSVSRFNDTPDEEGDYSTTRYTSTITTNENESEY